MIFVNNPKVKTRLAINEDYLVRVQYDREAQAIKLFYSDGKTEDFIGDDADSIWNQVVNADNIKKGQRNSY